MAGTVSSLGTLANGSSSVLSASLIDQLKSAETGARVNPITKQITTITNQKSSLSSLIVSLSGVKTATMDLSDEGSDLKRSATSSDSSVSISAGSGTATQDFSIKTTQLAQNHVMQSSGFAALTTTVSTTATTLALSVGGSNYNIDVPVGTTLEQLAQKINDSTNGLISASTLNTGVGSNPYQLILKAKNTGVDNTISVTEGSGLSLGLKNTAVGSTAVQSGAIPSFDATNYLKINGVTISGNFGGGTSIGNAQSLADIINNTSGVGVHATVDSNGRLTLTKNISGEVSIEVGGTTQAVTGLSAATIAAGGTIQNPQSAKFTYNGIAMERKTNTISDLITGATITLNSVSTNTANISIKQDTSGIPTLVNTFVSAFNSASSKIKDLTSYDSSTKKAGTLQGVAEVSGIYSSLTSTLTKVTSSGKSLMDYGFELDKNGTLSVNSATLSTQISKDPAALEELFRGSSKTTKATYTAAMTAGTANASTAIGDMKINGVDVGSVTTSSSNTAEQNAQLFVTAINKLTDTTGVKAYTDGSGKLILENSSGGNIKVTTNTTAAAASGLSGSSSSAAAMYNSLLASGKTTSTDGIFKQLNTSLAGLLTGSNASLTLLDASFQSQLDSRNEEKTNVTNDITTKYDLMANQFAQYNSIISKFQQSFASLQSMINSASSSGN